MNVDHVCLAVRSIDRAAPRLTEVLGFAPRTKKVTNMRQRVTVQFFSKPGSIDIKVIEPAGDDSPLLAFLKRHGEGLHHLGFKTGSVPDALAQLQERGARVTAQPQPGEAFDDEPIAFAYVGAGLNVEVIDTDKRRDSL